MDDDFLVIIQQAFIHETNIKNVIVLCLAMASDSVLAWTTGYFSGSVDIGGTIEKN